MGSLRLRQEGETVLLFHENKELRLPAKVAIALARELFKLGKKAEEWADAERITMDQAILLRTGAPFGLTDHPIIQREAARKAAWDSNLRRYLPGGVKSQQHVGTPLVRLGGAR